MSDGDLPQHGRRVALTDRHPAGSQCSTSGGLLRTTVVRRSIEIVSEVRCPTTRAALESEVVAIAIAIAHRAHMPVQVVRCRYCRWWHVVGIGSPLERPSRPSKRRRR